MALPSKSSTLIYPWTRYWVPREGAIAFNHNGFLVPPRSVENQHYLHSADVVEFQEISSYPCLALLGEPGIGKSFAIQQVCQLERANLNSQNEKILSLDIRSYGAEQRLLDDVFASQEMKWWREGNGKLTIFLDSLDECLLQIETVAVLLADEFSKLNSATNLQLRIACRTQDWPLILESNLKQCWKDGFRAYELAPLTEEQFDSALNLHKIPKKEFLSEIQHREVIAFALKPLTLGLLINIWKRNNGHLPNSQRKLFQQGCIALCEERNESRQSTRRVGNLSAEERYMLAQHIAGITIFSNRSAIWTGPQNEKLDSDVSLLEIASGKAEIDRKIYDISERNLHEVLGTGLFSSRGLSRSGWAHQAFAEFLAAEFLASRNFSDDQVNDLLFHPFGNKEKLVPQLRETAAWVAILRPAFFEHLLLFEPETLLASDFTDRNNMDKRRIIDALLNQINTGVLDPNALNDRRYSKLNYKGINAQLIDWIQDSHYDSLARCAAIDIAAACELDTVIKKLPSIALNEKESERVRIGATALISHQGIISAKRKLRSLALGHCKGDSDFKLRGLALNACFPGILTISEVLKSLEEPLDDLFGNYYNFVTEEIVKELHPHDLSVALEWAETQGRKEDIGDAFRELRKKILLMAANFLEIRNIRFAFIRVLFGKLRMNDNVNDTLSQKWLTWIKSRERERYQIAWSLFDNSEKSKDAITLTDRRLGLFVAKDINLLIKRLHATRATQRKTFLCQIIANILDSSNADYIDALFIGTQQCDVAKTFFAGWFDSWPLDGEKAKEEKEYYIQSNRFKKPPLPIQIEELNKKAATYIIKCESGEPKEWWIISRLFQYDDNARFHHGGWELTSSYGWKRADEKLRAGVIRTALPFLKCTESSPKKWFYNPNIEYHPSIAGLRALLLLREMAPEKYRQLINKDWTRWMPSIIGETSYSDNKFVKSLMVDAYTAAPRDFIKWLGRVILRENKNLASLFVLHRLPEPLPPVMERGLLKYLKTLPLKPECRRELLGWLIRAKSTKALKIGEKLLPEKLSKNITQTEDAIQIAQLLMIHGEVGVWPRIWNLIKCNPSFGRDLVACHARSNYHAPGGTVRALKDNEIADFHIWLMKKFPPHKDIIQLRGHQVDTRESIATYRDQLISHLADRGTAESCEALTRLCNIFPNRPWIRRVLLRAQSETRKRMWQPPLSSDLLALSAKSSARFIDSSDRLLAIIEKSIGNAQQRLQGETPLANHLWDHNRPKPEIEIAKFLKDHFEKDIGGHGVIINREVEVHWKKRTDIQIEAVSNRGREEFNKLCVIIEVKGCWNPELRSGLRNQLVDRYLTKIPTEYGIYLIGDFVCDFWDSTDPKKQKSAKFLTRVPELHREADELNKSGFHIDARVVDFKCPKKATTTSIKHRKRKK